MLDATDARLLLALDADPDATTSALALRLRLARNTVQARLARWRSAGLLQASSRRLDPAAMGYPLQALVTLSVRQRRHQPARDSVVAVPEVVELLATTGEGDLLARVVARDTDDLHRITHHLLDLDGIERTNTVVVLAVEKPWSVAPLLHRLLP